MTVMVLSLLLAETWLVNDAMVREEIREVVVLSTEGNETINLNCH
jgi:hypothetical protein